MRGKPRSQSLGQTLSMSWIDHRTLGAPLVERLAISRRTAHQIPTMRRRRAWLLTADVPLVMPEARPPPTMTSSTGPSGALAAAGRERGRQRPSNHPVLRRRKLLASWSTRLRALGEIAERRLRPATPVAPPRSLPGTTPSVRPPPQTSTPATGRRGPAPGVKTLGSGPAWSANDIWSPSALKCPAHTRIPTRVRCCL